MVLELFPQERKQLLEPVCVNPKIKRLMAISGAYRLLVFFEERKQTLPSQSGHQLYLILTV